MLILASLLIGVAGAQSATSLGPSTTAGSGPVVSSAAISNATASASSQGTIVPSSTSVSTAVPSVSNPAAIVPAQNDPPKQQWWCNHGGNASYCPGPLLQDVQLARMFVDSKTFVDRPTIGSEQEVFAAFDQLRQGNNVTAGQMVDFVNKHFTGEGLELEQVSIQRSAESQNVTSQDNITDPIFNAWVDKVDSYWELLIRENNDSRLCNGTNCDSSIIPLNHTIVVAGGRYHEIYYWDSYWIVQGLLASKLEYYAWSVLQNFMDFIETYGFIPNGGRKYYLNRSQPPVFIQMVSEYLKSTNNVTILERALPLMERELAWWHQNRTLQVTSPYSGKNLTVAHFGVNNSAPRPEGYVPDWLTANEAQPPLNQTQKEALYAELATGAESGWDYSTRWLKKPVLNVSDNEEALRSLNVRAIIPVDLNSLLSGDHALIADMYELWDAHQKNQTAAGGAGGAGGAAHGNQTSPSAPANQSTQAGGAGAGQSASHPAQSAQQSQQAPQPMTSAGPHNRRGNQNAQGGQGGQGAQGGQGDQGGQGNQGGQGDQGAGSGSSGNHTGTGSTGGAGSGSSGNHTGSGSTGGSTGGAGGVGGGNQTAPVNVTDLVAKHRTWAKSFADAILDLHWDANKTFFYDFNTTSNTRTQFYTAAGYFPLWQNITSPGLTEDEALRIVSGTRYLLQKYDGPPAAATYITTGLNWDFPNVWPPHVYTTIKGIEGLDRALTTTTKTVGNGTSAAGSNATSAAPIRVLPQLSLTNFTDIAPGQLGMNETQLPPQPTSTRGNTTYGNETQHLINGAAATLPWTQALALEIASRYMNSGFCSWYSTGGELNGTLARLPLSELNATGNYHDEPGVEGGKMFEKFNITDFDAAGGGGEYTVQIGFGWTNGVVLWAGKKFGKYLSRPPSCPLILITPASNSTAGAGTGGAAGGTTPASSKAPAPAGSSAAGSAPAGSSAAGAAPAASSAAGSAAPAPSHAASSAAPAPAASEVKSSAAQAPASAAAAATSAAGAAVSSAAPKLGARDVTPNNGGYLFVGRRVQV